MSAEAADRCTELERAFGEAVRRARTERGWMQQQVRSRLVTGFGVDLSSSAFSRLESGTRPTRIGEALALIALLGIDLAPLIPAAVADVCGRCEGKPPTGFTCNECAAEGSGVDR